VRVATMSSLRGFFPFFLIDPGLQLRGVGLGVPAPLHLFQAITQRLNKESQFSGIGFFGGLLGNLVPIWLRELRAVRVALVGHIGSPELVSMVLTAFTRLGCVRLDKAVHDCQFQSPFPHTVDLLVDRPLQLRGNRPDFIRSLCPHEPRTKVRDLIWF
jgi:hypothetical protein